MSGLTSAEKDDVTSLSAKVEDEEEEEEAEPQREEEKKRDQTDPDNPDVKEESEDPPTSLPWPDLNPLSVPNLSQKEVKKFEDRVINEAYLKTRKSREDTATKHRILFAINRLWRDYHLIDEFADQELSVRDRWELNERLGGSEDDVRTGWIATDSLVIYRPQGSGVSSESEVEVTLPKCSVHGSGLTGVDVEVEPWSDLDISVPFSVKIPYICADDSIDKGWYSAARRKLERLVDILRSANRELVSHRSAVSDHSSGKLHLDNSYVSMLFRKMRFHRIYTRIQSNRFPIIKARFIRYHKHTVIEEKPGGEKIERSVTVEGRCVSVDIGIESRSVPFRNSMDICYCLNPYPQLECLIRPFYCIIKYWAHQRGLITNDFGQSCVYFHLAVKFLQMYKVRVHNDNVQWRDKPLIPTVHSLMEKCRFPNVVRVRREEFDDSILDDVVEEQDVMYAVLSEESKMKDGFSKRDDQFYNKCISKQYTQEGLIWLKKRVQRCDSKSTLMNAKVRPPGLLYELLCSFFEMYNRFNFEHLYIAIDEYGLRIKPQQFSLDGHCLMLKPPGLADTIHNGTAQRRSNICPYITPEALDTIRAEMRRGYLLCSIGDPKKELFETPLGIDTMGDVSTVNTDRMNDFSVDFNSSKKDDHLKELLEHTGMSRSQLKLLKSHRKPESGLDLKCVSKLPTIVNRRMIDRVRSVEKTKVPRLVVSSDEDATSEEEKKAARLEDCLSCESPLFEWRGTEDELKSQVGMTSEEVSEFIRMDGILSIHGSKKKSVSEDGDSDNPTQIVWDVSNDVHPSWMALRLEKVSIPVVYEDNEDEDGSEELATIHPCFWSEGGSSAHAGRSRGRSRRRDKGGKPKTYFRKKSAKK